MAEYQNIFTRIQVRPPVAYAGVALPPQDLEREGRAKFHHLFGRLGDAQVGPIYLGMLGVLSIFFGTLAFCIIGINELQVTGRAEARTVRAVQGVER